jgi:branched-chain amino acid transport system permease protein
MQFLSYLINGISLGSVYALIALGYTMVYGIAKMLNFAHGDVIMIGSYVVFFAFGSAGMNPVLAIVLSMVVCTVLGVTIERVAYRPLREAPSLAVLITAIGVSYLLQQVAQLAWTSNPKSFISVVSGLKPISLFGGQLTISAETVVTIIACIVIMVVLIWFVNNTPAGHAMLAVSEDRGAAQLMGDDLADLCHRLCAGRCGRCAALLVLSDPAAHNRRHARHQGVRGRGLWRHRLYPGCVPRRYPAGHHREPEQGLHFDPAV